MKIGINLVGVSYNNGKSGRYRNYKDASSEFYEFIVNPLIEQGHEIFFYLYSYYNEKSEDILKTYSPIKYSFVDGTLNIKGGGDRLTNGMKTMSAIYINSLEELIKEDLDLIISTRFDIKFHKNPFEEYDYDFNKCNFLWREPEFMDMPIVNDTFIVFPHKMIRSIINGIQFMERTPPKGVNIGMHNIYLSVLNYLNNDEVQWVDDEFKTAITNDLYTLTRHD